MNGGLILRHTHRTAQQPSRPLPLGFGLLIGGTVSIGLWVIGVRAVLALLN